MLKLSVSEKRKKIEEMVLTTISKIDKTGSNTNKYKLFFKTMTDEKFEAWIKKFLKNEDDNFYLEILPYKNEPKLEDLVDAGKYLGVPLDEYVYYKNDGNKNNPIRSKYKVPVG